MPASKPASTAPSILRKGARKTLRVASAVLAATGWAPYDATKIDNLGFGKYANVMTNVIFERLAARRGPPADDLAPLGWQGAARGGLRAVRRIAGSEPSSLLLRRYAARHR